MRQNLCSRIEDVERDCGVLRLSVGWRGRLWGSLRRGRQGLEERHYLRRLSSGQEILRSGLAGVVTISYTAAEIA